MFRPRVVVPVRIELSGVPEVLAFHQALTELVAPRLRRSGTTGIGGCAGIRQPAEAVVVQHRGLPGDAARGGGALRTRRRGRAVSGSVRLRAWRNRLARFGVLEPAGEATLAELEAEEMAASLSGRNRGGSAAH